MTSPQGLAGRILPERGAAQKASASFAAQLTDSPGRSDGDSPSSSNPFREPAHGTKSVKYRYSATGKHLSSPLKGSSSSPERKPEKSQLKSMAAPLSHVAKVKVPPVATTSRKRKASPLPLRREDLLSSFLAPPSPLSSAPTSPVVPTNVLPPSPAPTTKEPVPDSPKRLPTLSQRTLGPTASAFSVLSQPLFSKRKQKKGKMITKKDHGAWRIGNSVWVLVNQSGMLADNSASLELSEQLMWWPAQVVQKQPLRVSLFGDFPSSSSTSRGLCTVFAPSSSNVLSVNDDNGAKRFSRTTFCLTSLSADDNTSPPTKKPRLDEIASIEAKWESAVQSMEKASTLERDGLPALLSSYATNGGSFYDSLDDSDPDTSNFRQSFRNTIPSQRKSKTTTESTKKLKSHRSVASLHVDIGAMTKPDLPLCHPDPTLQIPGELILALAPRAGGFYWPAKILEHIPSRKERYKVTFLDDKVYEISRDKFWTSEEEGFVQCTLGEWESAIKTTDDPESGDEGGEYDAEDDENATDPDDATSALPPPPAAENFQDLGAHAQLAYVKPVLRAILNKEYLPAREKHEAFMKGGAARVALLKSAGVRGGMDARFVKAVQKAICKWVLGDSGLKPGRLGAGDNGIATGGTVDETAAKVISPEVMPAGTLPMEADSNEDMVVPKDAQADNKDGARNTALLLSAHHEHVEAAQDFEMADDRQEQQPMSSLPANSVTLSPAVQQASLVAKSQLDLLAEVSQAVATEPSLLPSHPEAPKLNVDSLLKDTSPQPSPLTPIPDDDQRILPRRSSPIVCEEFETLSGVEKLDYCLNILLPESIQQLLLWRSGERTSSALFSLEEEQRLHQLSVRKATETDWVDDLMRLRAAQARLWGIDLSKKAEEKKAEAPQGGTRSRPRQSTLSRP